MTYAGAFNNFTRIFPVSDSAVDQSTAGIKPMPIVFDDDNEPDMRRRMPRRAIRVSQRIPDIARGTYDDLIREANELDRLASIKFAAGEYEVARALDRGRDEAESLLQAFNDIGEGAEVNRIRSKIMEFKNTLAERQQKGITSPRLARSTAVLEQAQNQKAAQNTGIVPIDKAVASPAPAAANILPWVAAGATVLQLFK